MMVLGIVGIETGLRAVDSDLAQQTHLGELVQRVVDRGERHGDLGLVCFFKKHFRGYMTIAFGEQKRAERDAWSCRAESDLTQLCSHVARRLWTARPQEFHFLLRS